MQGRGVGLGFEFGPDLRVAAGDLEPVDHGPHVKARSAHEHRHRAPVADVVDHSPSPGLDLGHRKLLGRIHQIEQVVGHLSLLRRGRRGRADVHAPIDLHRVKRHDLRAADQPGHT